MNTTISFIIPVYNVDITLFDRCIVSILEQDYKQIEIVIVDDGSKEEIANYCDEISATDIRISVIHQKNKGVSAARNNGVINCSGDYVMFVDADDIISSSMITEALAVINNYNCDMVIGAVCKISPNESLPKAIVKEDSVDLYDKYNMDTMRKFYMDMRRKEYKAIYKQGYIGRGPCARLIKKDVATKALFPTGLALGEDVVWNMRLLNFCNKVAVVKSIWYGYVIYNSSAVRKFYGNRKEIIEHYMQTLYKENSSFVRDNKEAYVLNLAREYYGLVLYEFLSPKFKNEVTDVKSYIKQLLSEEPWCLLIKGEVCKSLSLKYKIFILLSRSIIGLKILKLID